MKVLAVDTSGPSQGVALMEDERCLKEIFDPHPSSHSETLLVSIEEALQNLGWKLPDIDLFAVSVGPGSFTGLRIGISTVKGLCRALHKPVVGVSTLLALARPKLEEGRLVVPCLDARCGEVYAAVYSGVGGDPTAISEDRAWPIEGFLQHLEAVSGEKLILGDALSVYRARFSELADCRVEDEVARVKARDVALLGITAFHRGQGETGGQLQPKYLRVSEAENRLRRKVEE